MTTLELLHRRTSSQGYYNWSVAFPILTCLSTKVDAHIFKVFAYCSRDSNGGRFDMVHALHRQPRSFHDTGT